MAEQTPKQTVYIETTVISYLTAWTSRNVLRAEQQKITRDWWAVQQQRFDLLTSELVVMEASAGDATAAKARLEALSPLRILKASEQAQGLAAGMIAGLALPRIAFRDAYHLAIAASNGIDFLLTWNCTHLANAMLRGKIEQACADAGYRPPVVCTPEQLFAEESDGSGN